ncbi:MAG: DUF951 domain-containing protein [Candidatus Zipacnadales bacterium]
MKPVLKINPGDRVRLKKPHPCGCHEWEILRAGADLKMKCLGCGRIVARPRSCIERRIREFTYRAGENGAPPREAVRR